MTALRIAKAICPIDMVWMDAVVPIDADMYTKAPCIHDVSIESSGTRDRRLAAIAT